MGDVTPPSAAWAANGSHNAGHGRPTSPAQQASQQQPIEPWHQTPAAPQWGQPRHTETPPPAIQPPANLPPPNVPPPNPPPAPALPVMPPVQRPPAGVGQVSPAGPMRRTGADNWTRPQPGPRHRDSRDDEEATNRRKRQASFGDEPSYGPVLGFTAGWYGIPALFYVVWLVTLDSDRQAFVGRQLATSLPWLLAAVVLSLAIATLLRWATVGWRTLTLSFASAVIGAGMTTIAHSLTI